MKKIFEGTGDLKFVLSHMPLLRAHGSLQKVNQLSSVLLPIQVLITICHFNRLFPQQFMKISVFSFFIF